MVKGPGNVEAFKNVSKRKKMLSSPPRRSENTMDSFQDGGQMISEQSEFHNTAMEGSYMHSDMNNYGPGSGEQGMGGDNYGRMNDGHMSQYNSYNRPGYPNMDSNMSGSGEFPNVNSSFGQYQSGGRPGFMQQPGMHVRPGMGMMPSGYNPNQQRMMSGQNISQQGGPTPTLNQLLQTPQSTPRYPQNNYDSYSGTPQKPGSDMGSGNGPYGPPQSWMQNQRGYSQMPMSGTGPYRGQGPYNQQQGYGPQSIPPNSQYNNQQGSLQQQPQPPGQPPGQPQQRPTPQPSPHLSPAPSPISRVTPNPSPGPPRSTGQLSPGQQRPSPSPSQRSSTSISSPQPPGSSPPQQHNHQSSPKENSTDDTKLDGSSSLRPEPSPGSVGSRSTTPASVSGSSPMPPRPPSQQTDGQNSSHMSQSMPAPGYNQQMMPPPMGPNQIGYSPGNKMPGMGSGQFSHYNSQYSQQPGANNYPPRPGGPGVGNYPQNMYNGPGPMSGPGGNMYNNMGGPGMRPNYNMYTGQNVINSQYGSYSGQMGPGQTSQGGPGQNIGSPGPVNGPSSMNSVNSSSSGTNGPMHGSGPQGQTPIKGAQAAAQAAMAAANAAARSQPSHGRPPMNMSPGPRMYNPQSLGQSMPPQSMSPLSQMGQMNQIGYNSTMNNMPNHPQNSVSPVPNAMGHPQGMPGKSNSFPNSSEQPLPRSKSSKSKSMPNSVQPPTGVGERTNSLPGQGGTPSPVPDGSQNSSVPSTQKLLSTVTPDMSDTSTLSNDSTSLGPVNDQPVPDSTETISESDQPDSTGQHGEEQQTITTTANTTTVETTTVVTQSITSPVTSISTEPGNSNDSLSQPPTLENNMAQGPIMNSFGGQGQQGPPPVMAEEPVEKKRKTDVGSVLAQQPFARVAPSPGGASVASSGQSQDDVENIGSPCWAPKSVADYLKLYEMGNEPGRKTFLDRLFSFLEEKGTPINTMPVISKQPLDLYRLYVCVQEKGGMMEVTKSKKWKEICSLINISGSASAAFTLKKNYIKYMFAFECRYDRGGMDPAPILAQMEAQLQQKREAKHRNRAPSPAGSQGSQDGFRTPSEHSQDYGGPHMGGQYMNNNPNMGHMGPGMMNNMGPYGGSMGGQGMPHHMGMQSGTGHMMGNMPPQGMMPGNAGYMMQGGQGGMMQGGMGQGGMMGPGMQGQNSMMGNMPPHSGSMMPNSMVSNSMMGGMPPSSAMGNSNMPSNSMMQPNSMMGSTVQTSSMMGGGSQMSQANSMMRNTMSPSVGPNQGMGPNPNMGSGSMPGMMKSNSDSISCQDPFADEPPSFTKSNSMPPFAGVGQQSLPNSASPVPQQNVGMNPQISSAAPVSSAAQPPNALSPGPCSSIGSSGIPQSSASGTINSMANSSAVTSSSTAEPTQNSTAPMSGMPPQNMSGMPPQNMSGMPPQNMSGMPQQNMAGQNMGGMSSQNMSSMSQPYSMASMMPHNSMSPMPQSQNMSSQQNTNYPQQGMSVTSAGGMPMSSANVSGSNYRDSPDMNRMSTPNDMTQRGPSDMNASPAVDGQMGDSHGNQQPAPGPGNRQFPFGDQFTKPDRFDQSSPNVSQQGMHTSMPYSQHSQPPMMSQSGTDYSQGQNPPYGPQGYMGPGQGRYPNQMQSQPMDPYGQPNFPVNTPGYGPSKPVMNPDQYPGYSGQGYGPKPPVNMGQPQGIYNTPNKQFPSNRTDPYMSPAYGGSYNTSSAGYSDQTYTSHQYPDYGPDYGRGSDRRDASQWSPMPQRYQNVPSYASGIGMSSSGTPSMQRHRMSPQSRGYMSPVGRQKMGSGYHGPYYAGRKDMHFPPDSVEATQPLLNKRRRLNKNDIGQIEAWRLMMALKSGLLAESTWALDTLTVLLFDDTTVAYFGLSHLPGLVEVLLDHFRRNLIEMFNLFEETEIGYGHPSLKQELKSFKASIEKFNDKCKEEKSTPAPELKSEVTSECKDIEDEKPVSNMEKDSIKNEEVKMEVDEEEPEEEEDGMTLEDFLKSRKNYTMISRQGKEVKFDESVDKNESEEEKYWDLYSGFDAENQWWDVGRGDITEHIKTHLDDLKEHKNYRKRFFRKPMKLKDDLEQKSEKEKENPELSIKEESVKSEQDNSSELSNVDNGHSTNGDNSENNEMSQIETDVKELETKSENDKDTKELDKIANHEKDKDHTCNGMITNIKNEPRDDDLEASESTDMVLENIKEEKEEKNLFSDEPRMKLAVKYELLSEEELVQTCKNSFGINTEGERCGVEDEAYQRNEPPLCLISEARDEIGKRCICISNIFRSLSCIPGNDAEMSKHAGLVYILGKMLLLHHEHLARSRTRRKFDRDDIDEDMVDITQGVDEWWWDFLNILRENTLVIFANICAQLQLDIFPDEIILPVLEGLLHWVVCPSSCATDPLPTVAPTSVLSPLRLTLEAMSKLFIHQRNVDLLLATPPYERIVQLFSVLTKLLANRTEQVTLEFAVVLLSQLVQGGSTAARGIALQYPSISLLIDFIETAEQKAVQVVNMQGIQMLRDSPEMMGTSLDMLRRAAMVLLHLAKVPGNRKMFVHQQSRLLSLVMSQFLDQHVAQILSDVLFQCSQPSL